MSSIGASSAAIVVMEKRAKEKNMKRKEEERAKNGYKVGDSGTVGSRGNNNHKIHPGGDKLFTTNNYNLK